MSTDPAPEPPGKARSGTKVLIAVAVVGLVFLGVTWYATFAALSGRPPDRAFFTQEDWRNGTFSVYVSDIDTNGVVALTALTARVTAQDGTVLFDGGLGDAHSNGNWSLRITINDRDASGTLSLNDDLNFTALPADGLDGLLLSNFYLYANGVQWAHFQIPMV